MMLKALRFGYVASMIAGAPVCLFGLWAIGILLVGGLREDGPIEFPEPSLGQVILTRAAIVTFILTYLITVFTAHKLTSRPRLPFILLALPATIMVIGSYLTPPDPYQSGPDWIVIYLVGLLGLYVAMILLATFAERTINLSSL